MTTLRILERSDGQQEGICRVTFIVDPESRIFQGHFPEQPILPGICLVETALELIGGKTPLSVRAIRLKRPLFPGMKAILSAKLEGGPLSPKWHVTVRTHDQLVAQFEIDLKKPQKPSMRPGAHAVTGSGDMQHAIRKLPHCPPSPLG